MRYLVILGGLVLFYIGLELIFGEPDDQDSRNGCICTLESCNVRCAICMGDPLVCKELDLEEI